MSKSLRLTEKWMQRGLWLVALVFAGFLIGLGGAVVGDLPRVEKRFQREDFIPASDSAAVNAAIKSAERAENQADEALEQAKLKARERSTDAMAVQTTFENWLATRRVTQKSEHDTELLQRTHALDLLRSEQRVAVAAVQAQEQAALDASQAGRRARAQKDDLEDAADTLLNTAIRAQDLRVFLYRLLLTLPLLGLAGWLFVKKRKNTYWPFVWGYIFFAFFTFFVELVPYLPSYGGYVRYAVGIVLTALIGRQAIISLNRYLEKQKLIEQLPNTQRRQELSYDAALVQLSKGVCPGCERPADLKNPAIDFCPHCGIGLFEPCCACGTRKSTFAKFCQACGVSGQALPSGEISATP